MQKPLGGIQGVTPCLSESDLKSNFKSETVRNPYFKAQISNIISANLFLKS